MVEVSNKRVFSIWIGGFAAVALLNASLVFTNVWPTLGVRWTADLSAELAAVLLLLIWRLRRTGRPASPRVLGRLAWVWVWLAVGHYVDATTRSLYGRNVNLYWDLKLMPDVSAMFVSVANMVLMVEVAAAVVLVPWLLWFLMRWAFRRVSDAIDNQWARRTLAASSMAVLVLGAAQLAGMVVFHAPRVVTPVSLAYASEVGEVVSEVIGIGRQPIPPAPAMDANLSRVTGADVLLVFFEAYGAVSWEKAELIRDLASTRDALMRDIGETGRGVVSAMVESTTFGGESWLAQISLLSGTPVRTQDVYIRLTTQRGRDTMVKVFGRRGFRTVMVMPGLQHAWPEGVFYGFQEIYGTRALNYQGPPFSWWGLTDQFTLARLDVLELTKPDRAPLFAVFPTISSHAPFTPAPPYQPDWTRMLTSAPYDASALEAAYTGPADWTNLTPGYGEALNYVHRTLAGYLRLHADRDLVMVVVGDHQPAALVAGEGASWDVPVHVITSRPAVLAGLRAQGFRDGLAPARPVIATLDGLLMKLMAAFSD
jgi:hypothetical protein